ncbi:MAG: hypothetical protein VX589_02015 [Myxococcota bacterium]|nr:hypothetical protein [Myxococcota bacterium]
MLFAPMLTYILKRDRIILGLSALAIVVGDWFLPDAAGPRSWCLLAASLCLPFCVVGRSYQRAHENWLTVSRRTHRRLKYLVMEQLSTVLILGLFALLGGQGEWRATLALLTWGAAILLVSDAVDRLLVTPARVWSTLVFAGLFLLLSPLYLAPWFGQTALSPGLSSYAIGLHPIGLVLSAFGEPTLQNPLLYRVSLSGVVEVRPLTWTYGLVFYVAVSMVALWCAVYAERRHHVYDHQVLR